MMNPQMSEENFPGFTSPHCTTPMRDLEINAVKDLCIKHVPLWDRFTRDDMEVEIMSAAVTNRVFFVKLTHEDRHNYTYKLIVKQKTSYYSNVLEHEEKPDIPQFMSDIHIGPRVIARVGDFTFQAFVPGKIATNTSLFNMSALTGLASSLAKFHKKATERAPKDWDRTPLVFTQLEKWSKELERIVNKHSLDFDVKELLGFAETYKKVIANHVKGSKSICDSVLFCHNDLFTLNILHQQHGIFFIDFDYSAFNYVGWEITNFFVEMTTVYDTGTYPFFDEDLSFKLSDEMTSIFVSVYLSELLGENVLPSAPVVRAFMDSLEVHYLGVHVFWILWAIVMMDKPKGELSKPLRFDAYGAFQYKLYKQVYKKLSDKNRIRF